MFTVRLRSLVLKTTQLPQTAGIEQTTYNKYLVGVNQTTVLDRDREGPILIVCKICSR